MERDELVNHLTRQEDIISAALELTRAIDYGNQHPTDPCAALEELTNRVRRFYGHSYGPMPAPWLDQNGNNEELATIIRDHLSSIGA